MYVYTLLKVYSEQGSNFPDLGKKSTLICGLERMQQKGQVKSGKGQDVTEKPRRLWFPFCMAARLLVCNFKQQKCGCFLWT